jgi:hypothetical protein
MECNTKVVAMPLSVSEFESFHGGDFRRSETRCLDGQIDVTGRGAILPAAEQIRLVELLRGYP